jgi:DNA invertase Pin-like site-specific DNA recombinase
MDRVYLLHLIEDELGNEPLRDGDVFVVRKLDRVSRSLKDLLNVLERITEAGAGFRSLTERVDTTTAGE